MSKEKEKKSQPETAELLKVEISVVKDEQLFTFSLPYGFKFPSAKAAVKEVSDLIDKRSKEYEEHLKKQQEAAKNTEEKKEVSK